MQQKFLKISRMWKPHYNTEVASILFSSGNQGGEKCVFSDCSLPPKVLLMTYNPGSGGGGGKSRALSNKVSCFANQGLYCRQHVLSSFRGIYWNVYQCVCVCCFMFLGLISVKYPLQDANPVVCLPIQLATFVCQEHLSVNLYQLIIYRTKYYKPICFGNLEITRSKFFWPQGTKHSNLPLCPSDWKCLLYRSRVPKGLQQGKH